jgi:hypothetical protein
LTNSSPPFKATGPQHQSRGGIKVFVALIRASMVNPTAVSLIGLLFVVVVVWLMVFDTTRRFYFYFELGLHNF